MSNRNVFVDIRPTNTFPVANQSPVIPFFPRCGNESRIPFQGYRDGSPIRKIRNDGFFRNFHPYCSQAGQIMRQRTHAMPPRSSPGIGRPTFPIPEARLAQSLCSNPIDQGIARIWLAPFLFGYEHGRVRHHRPNKRRSDRDPHRIGWAFWLGPAHCPTPK